MKFNRRVGRKEVTGAGVLYDRQYFDERNDETRKAWSKPTARPRTSSTCCAR